MPPIINDVFLKTLLREKTSYTPAWIMRQAGRYLPEYLETRKKAGSFLDLCKNKDFATEVAMQPHEETQFSFKIIVSMIPTVFIGLYFEEEIASLFGGQIHDEKAIQKLDIPDVEEKLFEALQHLKYNKHEVILLDSQEVLGRLQHIWSKEKGDQTFLK